MPKYSKKGFISIFWAAIIMFVTTAIMVTATYMFSNFAASPAGLISKPFQDYYNAEFGISYGNVELVSFTDTNITTLTTSASYTYHPAIVVNGTNVTITITCLSPGLHGHYTIISRANNSTITANWVDGVLTLIN